MPRLVGGIEAGGTKFVCAVGSGPQDVRKEVRFPTGNPAETLKRSVDFFRRQQEELGPLSAIGIDAFGPVDPDPASVTYGYITTTPKTNWVNTDVVGRLQKSLNLPVGFDTDVNGAALGEWQWGAARGLHTFVYLTIGTGIGGGGMVGGRLMHGLIHPEMGHMRIPHDRHQDPFAGACPYHGDCLEGLAAGPAIERRWGRRGEQLPPDHQAWQLEARYLAYGLVNVVCLVSPQRIILGGGVMEQSQLFPLIRNRVQEMMNDYLQSPRLLKGIDEYIVPPGLGKQAGILGAFALAYRALDKAKAAGEPGSSIGATEPGNGGKR